MSNIAIITARGGSKRIPHKNIKNFCGKPIMAYSIEAARKSGIFDEVMVSTDDMEIADVAREYGASVPFMRSAKTSNDFATTKEVMQEVLQMYEAQGKMFHAACCIYPTAPFVTDEKLKAAMAEFNKKDVDWLVPVVAFGFPPQRAMIIREGQLHYQYPEYTNTRSQDLEKIYHDCGQFYIYNVEVLLGKKKETGITIPYEVSEEETQDIDNFSDWIMAELKYKKLMMLESKKDEI